MADKSSASAEVQPDVWVMPNRKGYPQWMHQTFAFDKYKKASSFFPHQRIIRDVMHTETPYRGVLLFHGLGVGKTCASIAATEAYIAHGRKVVIMVPASLATNYRQEIMKCASIANPSALIWHLVETPQKAQVWVPGSPDVAAKRGNIVKKGQAWSKLTAAEKELAIKELEKVVAEAFTFVNYNGLTLKAWSELTKGDGAAFFKDAFIVMDEAHNFMSRVANGGKVARRIYEDMMKASSARLVLLTGTPVINHPYELCLLLNLVRGIIKLHTLSFIANTNNLPSEAQVRSTLGSDLVKYIDHLSVSSDTRKLHFTLCPEGFFMTHDNMLVRAAWDETTAAIMKKLEKKLKTDLTLDKRMVVSDICALPTSKEEFIDMYMDVTDPDAPKVKNMDMFMRRIAGLVSYVRTTGEENFPEVTLRQHEMVPMSDFQFRLYNKVRGTERTLENKQKKQSRMLRGTREGLFGAKGTVYRAFSRMACNFVFPDDIQRKYPMDLRKELQRVLAKEMDVDPVEDEEAVKEESDAKAKEQDKKLAKEYENNLKQVMKGLKENAASILTREKLYELYSPKIARLLEHVDGCPGKCLIYSQFRSIEGLGVVQLALEQAGFVRVEVSKKGQGWSIVNGKEVMSKAYDGRRYIVFDADREKTKVLLHMYNGEFDQLPTELLAQLKELRARRKLSNLRGELIKTLMITQSGAEGISLKNVRRVMILEPFWNMVRMDQVVGRAVRNNSHKELPEEERKVEVYIYTTVFTQKQLDKDFTLRNLDDGLTSDSHILRIAQGKDEIIQTFLNHMKMASLDCRAQAQGNKLAQQGIRCYAFPVPVQASEESYVPDPRKDAIFKSRMVRARRVQGKVMTHKTEKKKYVVVDDYPGKVFDYDAYKFAGVLEEVSLA